MQVLVADVLGMCFGVRDALKLTETVANPQAVTVHGELVHNELVLERLRGRGFQMVSETSHRPVPVTPLVLITAHGISDTERRRLVHHGKQLIDTTCPLVTRAHRAARGLHDDGYFVLVIGRPGHVEVQGIIEDLQNYQVISTSDDVQSYASPRLGIVCQTTATQRQVQVIRRAIEAKNPQAEIRFLDTVCHPTKDHQQALEKLIPQVQAMVVVGGKNSNNTKELVLYCREKNLPTFHVQGPGDLRPDWFRDIHIVGLTAGTSTLDATIEQVRLALLRLSG